jgi:UDP-glucose 4-epimerase
MVIEGRYLVTGGAGFIGSHIVKRLVDDGQFVRVVDNLATGNETRLNEVRAKIDFFNGDLADEAIARTAVEGIDFVVHQAAIPSVQRSLRDPVATNRANVVATLNLLESARQLGVRRFIYAASSSAYGDTEVLPKHEDMPANPRSPYALQKFVGERYCKLYFELYGLETVSLRYFNVFGPGQDPDSEYSAVIPKFVSAILCKRPITIHGDGEQSRDFTYVDNVVEANLLAIASTQARGMICNIGCGERISLNRLVKSIEKRLRAKAEPIYGPTKPGDVKHSLADLSRANAVLSYHPKITFEEGLDRTVEFFCDRQRS